MNDGQLTFFNDTIAPESLEEVLNSIILSVCISHEVDTKYVSCRKKKRGYSVWIRDPITLKDNFRVFSITVKNKNIPVYSVEIIHKRVHSVPIPEGVDFDKVQKSTIFIPFDHAQLRKYLTDVLTYSIEHFEPSEKFGCCGKYIECSDAQKCLHCNTFYAKACYYRKNLEAGRIFYGKNSVRAVEKSNSDERSETV